MGREVSVPHTRLLMPPGLSGHLYIICAVKDSKEVDRALGRCGRSRSNSLARKREAEEHRALSGPI